MTDIQIISAFAAAVVLTAVVTFLLTSRKMRGKVAYMLDALEDKELNFRFDERRLAGRKFNRTLNRLRNIFDKERHEIIEQEKYFGLMLDHVKTGVVVIEQDGRVNYCNRTALNLLGIATFGHIRQLRTVSESLYNAFLTVTDAAEERASYYNESGKMTISLTASAATIGKMEVRVVAFNDISSEIAENEQESWSKLIRVLTHEIMNTVTPIASLSETLLTFEGVNEEVKSGLDTISQSSKGLIKFVDSYRNLTRVAPPVKKAFYFKELAERVINLTREQALMSGVQCSYVEKSEDIILYADEGQITQILINLVKNAIQADAKKVEITAEINLSEHIIINVFNDGSPISKESQEEIFVPFFTTKQEGTGIGLSLSRQIMRLHNGTLALTRSDDKGTIFTLTFR
ncbi:MAG: PAS domain-containing sensor histidine kinase [Bacteroidales bacterium]|nr:PAS domain-containing sensor histidine kinase [Bacteroidales bacterium]